MPRLRLGILGTGNMAGGHAYWFARVPGVELTACMDIDADRAAAFAAERGVKHAMTDVADVLDACDAVSIVTPDAFHVPLLLEALAAGKHVLCEKPLALNLADARKAARAAAAATERGLVHMVNFSHRSACFAKARKLIAAGKLGEVRYFRSWYLQQWVNASSWDAWEKRETWPWRMSTAAGSGGALGDLGCHVLDYVTALTGPARRVQCRFGNYPKLLGDGRRVNAWNGSKLDANESALLTLELAEGGVLGTCEVTRVATGYPNEIAAEVFGTHGGVRIRQGDDGHRLETCFGTAPRHDPPTWTAVEPPKALNNWQAFVRAIKRGEPAEPDVLRGAEVQAYLDAAERSAAADGAPMTVKKWA